MNIFKKYDTNMNKTGRSPEDKHAEDKTDGSWSDRNKISAIGTDVFTANRVANEVAAEVANPVPEDSGIRSLNDFIPESDIDSINKTVAEGLMGTDTMPDPSRAMNIGKTIIEVSEVTPTPERIEVHIGTHSDVA